MHLKPIWIPKDEHIWVCLMLEKQCSGLFDEQFDKSSKGPITYNGPCPFIQSQKRGVWVQSPIDDNVQDFKFIWCSKYDNKFF